MKDKTNEKPKDLEDLVGKRIFGFHERDLKEKGRKVTFVLEPLDRDTPCLAYVFGTKGHLFNLDGAKYDSIKICGGEYSLHIIKGEGSEVYLIPESAVFILKGTQGVRYDETTGKAKPAQIILGELKRCQ